MKVSILMPLYNAESWLRHSIASVKDQTYSNWELIIVDNGSTDSSLSIAESYALQDERIKVYKQNRKGACAARNLAFARCSGSFIQYLDADDTLVANKLEYQLKLIKGRESVLASSKFSKFNSEDKEVDLRHQQIDKSYENPINWLIDAWKNGEHSQTSCWLTPRNLIEDAGPWNESLIINQDGEFFSRVLLEASAIDFADAILVNYRMDNVDSVSQGLLNLEKARSLRKSYLEYEKSCRSKGVMNRELNVALLCNFFRYLAQTDRYFPSLSGEIWNRIRLFSREEVNEALSLVFRRIGNLTIFKTYLLLARVKR